MSNGLPQTLSVCIFASAFHPSLGGVEELCRQLAHEYLRRGWRVCIVTNRWPRSLPPEESFEGIPVYRVAMRTPDSGLKSRLTYHLTTWLSQGQLANILRRERVDVIHVQCVGCNGYYACQSASKLGLPLVVSLQGELTMDATGLFERSAFARETLRRALAEADWVTACSSQTLGEAEAFYGEALPRSMVIHNGIRAADFADAAPERRARPFILGMGRHVPQKGFDVLIRSMAELASRGQSNLDLLIAGDGPETGTLNQLVKDLGLSERVVFTGRADRKRAGALLSGCELFVLPSRHEPFGIVNLEAMACGVPVVAARTGGVPEFVEHGMSGWLVEPNDPVALADGIARILADDALRQMMVRNGRSVARDHDWSSIADIYEKAYRTTAEEIPLPAGTVC